MSTPALLSWLLQSSLGLGACWLLYYALLRREPAFQFNRGLLLLAPLLTAALPLLPLPASWLAAAGLPELAAGGLLPAAWLPEVQVRPAAGPTAALPWLLWLYGAGVLLSLLLQAGRLLRFWLLTRHLPRQAAADHILRLTGGRLPTSSFGRTVFWDETAPLTPAEAAQVLRHELTHVRQGHTADRLWLSCWQCVLWFNPFVHLCARSLTQTHEYLADAAAAPVVPTAYTALLARQALAQFTAPILAHSFSTSQTLTRIAMLNRQMPARRWKQWLVLPLTGLLLSVAACEKATPPMATVPPPPPPAEAPAAGRVLEMADEMPEYQGGMEQLMQDLGTLVKYPEAARAAKLEGKVFVGFVVAADGSMQDVTVKKGVSHPLSYPGEDGKPVTTSISTPADQALDQAALQAVKALPGRWTPGRQDGQPVAVAYTIPITFALD